MLDNRKNISGSQVSRRNVTQEIVNDALEELKDTILSIFNVELTNKIDELNSSLINEVINENKKLTAEYNKMVEKVKEMQDKLDYFED